MCWKKQTIWTSCWHTTSESGICPKQERQTQQNLDGHDPNSQQPAPRPLWMLLLCFPCAALSQSSPPPRKRCRTETFAEGVGRLCPRCQTIRDAPCLVPGRAPAAAAAAAAANSHAKFDVAAEEDTAQQASAAKRRGFVGDGNIHPVGHPDSSAGQSSSPRDRRASSSSRSGRQRQPREQSRPRRDAAAAPPSPAPSPRDSTEHLRPAPLRIPRTKHNQVPTQPEASTRNKNVSSKSKSSTKKKRGRSAVELMANQPMSTLVEDVEKTWEEEDGSGGRGVSAAGQAPYAPYTPDLSLDGLFEEVELMWQRGVEPLPPAAGQAWL